jgi:hypothetical protein
MKTSRRYELAAALFVGALSMVPVFPATAAADEIIRASCSERGRVVHREDMAANASPEKRLSIAAARPNALCIFLKVGEPADRVPSEGTPLQVQVQAAPANAPSAIGAPVAQDDLAKALAFISDGRDKGPSSVAAYSNPDVFNDGPSPFAAEKAFSKSTDSVNLTIGVYDNATSETVNAHWNFIKSQTSFLAQMTPSIKTVDGVTVLTLENVMTSAAAKACEEAEKYASGCIAVY